MGYGCFGLSERDLKVHQLMAAGVADSGDEETRALSGIFQATDIEEEKTLLARVPGVEPFFHLAKA